MTSDLAHETLLDDYVERLRYRTGMKWHIIYMHKTPKGHSAVLTTPLGRRVTVYRGVDGRWRKQ